MQIKNIGNVSMAQLSHEVNNGGRFVLYQYCVSIVFMTFKRGTDIYYIPPGESKIKHSWGFTALSATLGWWGFPWGPIYTIQSLVTNLGGGKDVTKETMMFLNRQNSVATFDTSELN